jgi:hypothetical protein
MKQLRRLEQVLVVMMLMLVLMAPSAYADGSDVAGGFAYYLWQYFGY